MYNKLIALVLATLLVGCSSSTPQLDSTAYPAQIVFATDLHYLSQSLTDNGEGFEARMLNGDGKMMVYLDQIAETFVEKMLELSPDVVVLGGDLTLNGEAVSHRDLATKLERLTKNGVPVLVIPGNHDVDNYMSSGFEGGERYSTDTVDRKGFAKSYDKLGAKQAIAKDKTSMSYIYPVRSDLWLLMLDVNENDSFGNVTDSTYQWLEEWLGKASQQGVQVVGVSHQNILQHNPHFSAGYVIEDSDRLVELFEKHNVRLNLSGHIHLQHIETTGSLTEVVTTSLAVTPHRYGLVEYDGSTLYYSAVGLDVAGWAFRQGSSDPRLLDFANYSHQTFWDMANIQAMADLVDWGIPDDEVEAMSAYYADINTAYFEGRQTTRSRDEDAFALWERYEKDSFRYLYITSMLDSGAAVQDAVQVDTTK